MQETLATEDSNFYTLPHPPSTPDSLNRLTIKELFYWARFEGAQIRIDNVPVYSGAEFPTDTSAADSALEEIWCSCGESFTLQLLRAKRGATATILEFRNCRWAYVKSFTLL